MAVEGLSRRLLLELAIYIYIYGVSCELELEQSMRCTNAASNSLARHCTVHRASRLIHGIIALISQQGLPGVIRSIAVVHNVLQPLSKKRVINQEEMRYGSTNLVECDARV